MYIKITYLGTVNGITGIWCGFKPDNIIIKEERNILYPENGYELVKNDEHYNSVWLKNGDVPENYTEIKKEEEDSLSL